MAVKQKDMIETLSTSGVLTTTAKEHLYFDYEWGSFQTFLVNEGDIVLEGEDLYTYRVHHYEDAVSRLEQQIEQFNEEIEVLESIISSVDSYTIDEIPSIHIQQDDEDIVEIIRPPVDADWMKAQYQLEIEKEMALKEAQLESVEAQLSTLKETGHTITVTSPYEGIVTMVSESLDDPLMTIETPDLHIESDVVEQDRPEVAPGMTVDIYVPAIEQTYEGTVDMVSDIPKETTSKESVYTFHVTFSEGADLESLLAGYHAELRVITKEALEATAISDEAIFDGEVWLMTDDGKLIDKTIDTGIYMGEWYEVIEGLSPNELVAIESLQSFRHGSTFITPLKLKSLPLKKTLTDDELNRWKLMLLGLVSR